MKKYLKFIGAALALVAVIMMFFNQVTVEWASKTKDFLNIQALVGGKYPSLDTDIHQPCWTGLAGYILLGVAALILLVVALVPYFKEHDILSVVVTGVAAICLIIGIIFLFLIRKNFADGNGFESSKVYVGWAAIAAGSLGGLAIIPTGLSMVLDLTGSN